MLNTFVSKNFESGKLAPFLLRQAPKSAYLKYCACECQLKNYAVS